MTQAPIAEPLRHKHKLMQRNIYTADHLALPENSWPALGIKFTLS